jgi:hypothetical protein
VTLVSTMETMHAAGRRSLPPVPRATTGRPTPQADLPEPEGRDPESPTERFVVDLATGEQRTVSAADAIEDEAAAVVAPVAVAVEDDAPAAVADEDEGAADDADPVELVEGDGAADDASEDAEAAGDDAPDSAAGEVPAPADDDTVEDDAAQDDAPALDAAGDARDDTELDVQEQPRAEDVDLDPAQEYVARLRAAAADFAEAAGAESAVVREAVPPARHRRARCRLVLRYADESEVDVTFLGPAGRPGTPSRHGFDRQIRRWLADGQHREDAWLVDDEDASDGLAVDLSAWVAAA